MCEVNFALPVSLAVIVAKFGSLVDVYFSGVCNIAGIVPILTVAGGGGAKFGPMQGGGAKTVALTRRGRTEQQSCSRCSAPPRRGGPTSTLDANFLFPPAGRTSYRRRRNHLLLRERTF